MSPALWSFDLKEESYGSSLALKIVQNSLRNLYPESTLYLHYLHRVHYVHGRFRPANFCKKSVRKYEFPVMHKIPKRIGSGFWNSLPCHAFWYWRRQKVEVLCLCEWRFEWKLRACCNSRAERRLWCIYFIRLLLQQTILNAELLPIRAPIQTGLNIQNMIAIVLMIKSLFVAP